MLDDGGSLGGDGGDRVSHVTHSVTCQDVAVEISATVTHIRRIGGRHHGVHAGQRLGFAGVDADDLRVGVLAAQNAAMQLVFEHQIDAVDALTCDALDAAYPGRAGAHDFEFGFCHDLSPPCDSVGGEVDRVDNFRVPRAATDVAGHRLFDLLRSRIFRAVEKRFDGHDEAGRAVAALNRAGINKCLLHRVQLVSLRQSFHSDDLRVGGVHGEHDARIHRLAVE